MPGRTTTSAAKVGILGALYFAEGLPFGFQATALPVLLRSSGISLTAIGWAYALSLPWMLKILWAPLVDRFGPRRFGRRRAWIVPNLTCLAAAALAAAALEPGTAWVPLLALVFAMNLAAATLDIAVDGLAVDLLEPRELGYGNIAQVVGYKLGMLTGGGLLLWASAWVGWRGLFASMAALIGLVLVIALTGTPEAARPISAGTSTLREVVGRLAAALRAPGAVWLLVFIGTYKLGETMADAMFRPFLVDLGFRESEIGWWIGTWGMGCSLAGSFAGGVLASHAPRLTAVGIAAAARILPLAAQWGLALAETPARGLVVAVTSAEHFFGGALTTAMFAYMMGRVDRRIGATHYTLLATVEVLGKNPAAWISGALADRWGYAGVFGLAVALSVAYLGLLLPARLSERRPGARPAAG